MSTAVGRILRRLDTPDDIAERERRRIRRLIALIVGGFELPCSPPYECRRCTLIRKLDAATRAPKKQKTVGTEVRCRTCGAGFDSKRGNSPCRNPSPGREYVDTGKGNHIFLEQTRVPKKARTK